VDGVAPARRIQFLRLRRPAAPLSNLLTGNAAVHLDGGILRYRVPASPRYVSQGVATPQHCDYVTACIGISMAGRGSTFCLLDLLADRYLQT